MERKLALCVLGLCVLSSGCGLIANATRNLYAEICDTTEVMFERVHERRAVAVRECCAVEASLPDGGKDGLVGVVKGPLGPAETPQVRGTPFPEYLPPITASPRPVRRQSPEPSFSALPLIEPDLAPSLAAIAAPATALSEVAPRAPRTAPQDNSSAADARGSEPAALGATLGEPHAAHQAKEETADGPTLPGL